MQNSLMVFKCCRLKPSFCHLNVLYFHQLIYMKLERGEKEDDWVKKSPTQKSDEALRVTERFNSSNVYQYACARNLSEDGSKSPSTPSI